MKKLLVILLCLFASFAILSCGEGSSSKGGGGGGGGISLSASVTGAVSADVISSVFNVLPNGRFSAAVNPGACASSAFNVKRVGGNGTTISSGTAGADGSFTAQTTADDEVVIDFTSCSIKCFGKPNSTGLLCDPLANAVVLALEEELGESVDGSTLFEGLSIAKIAEGMIETLKLISKLDPTNDYGARIKAANGDPATLLAIIKNSPVGTLFTTIGTLSREKKIENQALEDGDSAQSALEEAAKQSWTMDKIMDMVAGLGLEVHVSFDAGSGESIYAPMFQQMDSWSETDFMAQMQKYVSDLYTLQYVNKQQSSVSLLCSGYNWSASQSKEITYPPFFNGEYVTVTINGVEYTDVKKLSCIDQSTVNNVTDALSLSTLDPVQGIRVPLDTVELNASLQPTFQETNRNDPTGTRGYEFGKDSMYLSLIDVFTEFMNAMMPAFEIEPGIFSTPGFCGQYVQISPEGDGPAGFDAAFDQCIKTHDKNGNDPLLTGLPAINQYFAGVLGIFKFMRDPDLRSTRFSLNDLYATMTGRDGMAMRLNADLWKLGVQTQWVQFRDTTNDSGYIPAYNLQPAVDATTGGDVFTASGRQVYDLVCPPILCPNAVPSMETIVLTTAEQEAALYAEIDATKPSFASSVGMFQNVPDMNDIKNSIFQDAHHVDYNIAGQKTFYAKGVSTDYNQWDAEVPILCHLIDTDAAGNFVAGSTRVECVKADAVTWDADGYPSDLTTYAGYYALQERGGGNNDGSDRYYGLMSMNTGMDYRVNGRDFRIRGIRTDVSIPAGVTLDGQTYQSINQEFCNTYTDGTGQTLYNCWQEMFDYVAVPFEPTWFPETSYNPYTWYVPMTDSMGNQWSMPVGVSNAGTATDFNDDFSVCIKGGDGTNQTGVVVNTNDSTPDTSIVDNLVLQDPVTTTTWYLDKCSAMTGTFYYLNPNWGALSRSGFTYHLVRNDGQWMYQNNVDWAPYNINIATIETALNSALIGGSSLQAMGPETTSSWLNGYEVANLNHDPKFDPFCDDVDGNGECNCEDTDGDLKCTLADNYTEPTFSDPPYWSGNSNASAAAQIIAQHGGLSGIALVNSLRGIDPVGTPVDFNAVSMNWDNVFECANHAPMKWANFMRLTDINDDPSVAQYAGEGCGTYDWMGYEGMGTMGPVRMRKLIARNNAYDIGKPNTLLKLMSAATATTGTGVAVDPNNQIYGFQEAMALTIVRGFFPPKIAVRYNNQVYEDISVYFDTIDLPGKNGNTSTGLLRGFMQKAIPNL